MLMTKVELFLMTLLFFDTIIIFQNFSVMLRNFTWNKIEIWKLLKVACSFFSKLFDWHSSGENVSLKDGE